jgi:hypothetical protein
MVLYVLALRRTRDCGLVPRVLLTFKKNRTLMMWVDYGVFYAFNTLIMRSRAATRLTSHDK